MNMISLRSISVAAAALVMAASANALTIDWTKLQGTSTLNFSADAISLFNANGGKLKALGNTTPADTTGWNYVLPITSIEINGSLKVASGQASGSALDITRRTIDEETGEITKATIVLANFKLDYIAKKVLADTTANGTTTPLMAVYDFNVATPLALKYKFPLTVTGHEVLNKMVLTSDALAVFATALGLAEGPVLDLARTTDFGTLTQDINTNARKPAVNKTPYVPAP